MRNRLGDQTSPYLLQHRDNPVHWQPWDDRARATAVEQDKPILLSIGYSACHWCHVMEHESFEDPATAAYMNEHFVCIKVDREERPDVDDIYMEAVQGITGQGGWPLTAFCDPDGVPFHGGTYFPPQPRHGMPSFRMVMEAVVEAWRSRGEEIRAAAERTRTQLGAIARIEPAAEEPGEEVMVRATENLLAVADPVHGGFGGAPKFPPASALEFLLMRGQHDHLTLTLDAMAAGGMHDQIGGGFARYSVDREWLVPHFEKMLYDNALLARAYLHGFQALGHERWRRVCLSTLDWAIAEMRGPEGGFASALDADSEGVEGKFYLWDEAEVRSVLAEAGLGDSADELVAWWGVTGKGNFEGSNILTLAGGLAAEPPADLEAATAALYEVRSARVWPGIDDKRIASWNALVIGVLAEVGAALARPDLIDAGRAAAEFVLGEMRDQDGRLLRTWRGGTATLNAYLEDHAYLVDALLHLYEATFEPRWYQQAEALAETMLENFGDPELGGFFTTSHDHEELIARRKDLQDHPIPSGSSAAALALLRLEALSGKARWGDAALGVIKLLSRSADRHPSAMGHLLQAIGFRLGPVSEVALISPGDADVEELAVVVRSAYHPRMVLAGGTEGATSPPLLRDRPAIDGRPTAYVCEAFTCKAPVTSVAELEAQLLATPL